MKTLIRRLKEEGRCDMALLLCLMSAACFFLSLLRCAYTGTCMYLFLNWNLFLAAVPWVLSSAVILRNRTRYSRPVLLILFGAWVLFFPNSPYILTDMFHLRYHAGAPMWFDLVLILSFAWTGMLFGFVSLFDIEAILTQYMNRQQVRIFVILLLFTACFGVYLGRCLRWNSWDIVADPLPLLSDIANRFANPLRHLRTWGITVIMGIMLNVVYHTLCLIQRKGLSGRQLH